MRRRPSLLKSLVERKGIKILLNANTARIRRRDAGRGRRTDRRAQARGRCGDLRRRHPAQHCAGEGSRHSRQSRRRRRRSSADRRLRISSRSANAPSIAAPATAWSSRPTSRRGCWRGICRARPAAYDGSVVSTNLKVSGVSVFSAGDFVGAEGSETIVLSDFRHGSLQEARDCGRPPDRRGAGRRYPGCALVSRIDPQPRADRRHPPRHDVRPRARASGQRRHDPMMRSLT